MNFRSSNPLMNLPVVVKNLMIITVICFLAQKGLPAIGFDFTEFFALHHWRSDLFYPHQLITYIFLHSTQDFSHLLFNMFGLYMFGRVLESTMGEKKFLMYYLITGVGAGLIQMVSLEVQLQFIFADIGNEISDFTKASYYRNLINSLTVGASGSVFGILMAFGYLFPNAQLQLLFPPIPIKGKYIAVFALVLGIFTDLQGNVAHFAHFGGMLTGFILLKIWQVKSQSFM